MECDYKDLSDRLNPIRLPQKLLTGIFPEKPIIVTKEVPEEVIYIILSKIKDCLAMYNENRVVIVNDYLEQLCQIIKDFYPFPSNNSIIDSGIFEMCLSILKRDVDRHCNHTIVIFLSYFAQSSVKYLRKIATNEFEYCVEHYMNQNYIHLNIYLVGISNLILQQNSEISTIFKEFDMTLISPLIDRINTNFGSEQKFSEECIELYKLHPEDLKHLEMMNFQIFRFLSLMTNHVMNHDVWLICFECVIKLINRSFLSTEISRILLNLMRNILENNENCEEVTKKYELLTKPEIVDFVKYYFFAERLNLFIYVVYFIFKYNENLSFFSFSINSITTAYFQLLNGEIPESKFTEKDDMLFTYIITNLLIKDNSLVEDPDVINFTSFLFNQKLDGVDYNSKKMAILLFCSFISINPLIFFSENVVDFDSFMSFFNDFVNDFDFDLNNDTNSIDDMVDLELVNKLMDCLIKIHSFIKENQPTVLEQLMNSECVRNIQQFVDKYGGIIVGNDRFRQNVPVLHLFMERFPLMNDEEQ